MHFVYADIALDAENKMLNQIDKNPCPRETCILMCGQGEEEINQNYMSGGDKCYEERQSV